MAKTGLLSPLRVGRETKPGRLSDGGGLYLQIKPTGSKSWLWRYKVDGKTRMLGLGPFPDVSLAAAREKAAALRAQRRNGVDPRDAREAARLRQQLEAAQTMTFRQCAAAFIAGREGEWKNEKHRQQWRNSLATYAYPDPHIGDLPVGAITPRLVLNVLEQKVPVVLDAKGTVVHAAGTLWAARPETARRLRARIEAVLDWARVKQYREGDNPARWHGNLEYSLSKTQKREHHAALPYGETADFVGALRQQDCVSAAALEFLILTAMRTSEVLGARWDEIDEEAALWTVPGSRMKMKREHRVPLSSAALAVLARMRAREASEYVFPGSRSKKRVAKGGLSPAGFSLSNMTLLTLLRRMKRDDITPHGMRSTFRDWAAECTSTPSEVAEMSLAHTIKNKVEAAYRRGDLFEKRRALMQAWADFCEGRGGAEVVQFGERAA